MLQEASKVTLEVSVLRRLLFAVVNVPEGTPSLWETICAFAFNHSVQQFFPLDVQLLLDNIEFLDTEAFSTDAVLMKELHSVRGQNNCPLGVVLGSPNTVSVEESCLHDQIDLAQLWGTVKPWVLSLVLISTNIVKTSAKDVSSLNVMVIIQKEAQVTATTMKTGTL